MPSRRKARLIDVLALFGGGLVTYQLAYAVIAIAGIRQTVKLDFWLLGLSVFGGVGALLLRVYWRDRRHLDTHRRGFSVDPPRRSALGEKRFRDVAP